MNDRSGMFVSSGTASRLAARRLPLWACASATLREPHPAKTRRGHAPLVPILGDRDDDVHHAVLSYVSPRTGDAPILGPTRGCSPRPVRPSNQRPRAPPSAADPSRAVARSRRSPRLWRRRARRPQAPVFRRRRRRSREKQHAQETSPVPSRQAAQSPVAWALPPSWVRPRQVLSRTSGRELQPEPWARVVAGLRHVRAGPSARAPSVQTRTGLRLAAQGGRSAASIRSRECPGGNVVAPGAVRTEVITHLKRRRILRDLASGLVVVERVEKHELDVLERVQGIFVFVLGKGGLDAVDATRLRYNL